MAISLTKVVGNLPWKRTLASKGPILLAGPISSSTSTVNLSMTMSKLSLSDKKSTTADLIHDGQLTASRFLSSLFLDKNNYSRRSRASYIQTQQRHFSTSNVLLMERFDRKAAVKQHKRTLDDGTRGEMGQQQAQEVAALELKLGEVDKGEGKALVRKKKNPLDWMPRPEDYEHVYENGKKYKELPIIYLNATKNTTKLAMFDARRNPKSYTTCGIEGIKGAKKGTNIAAQTIGMSFAKKLVRLSKVTHARLIVKGLGPGRVSALEGLVMGGLNVVSVTDDTPVYGLDQGQGPGPRPRKRRRV